MIQYITPYWGPLVFESQIDKEFIDLLLEKGQETIVDARKDLAGQIDKEFYYENYNEWFIPKFKEYIESYIDAAIRLYYFYFLSRWISSWLAFRTIMD